MPERRLRAEVEASLVEYQDEIARLEREGCQCDCGETVDERIARLMRLRHSCEEMLRTFDQLAIPAPEAG